MLEENWDEFPQILREMLVAGLVVRRDDGTYALTILGLLEVESDRAVHGRPSAPALPFSCRTIWNLTGANVVL
jgi:hypothetical protein